jgi:hypothetical protein
MEYQLETRFDSRKSFYGKAVVIHEGNRIKLKSYNTIVAYIDETGAHVNGTYSPTTLRHIKEFLLQHGYEAGNKAFIEKEYVEA